MSNYNDLMKAEKSDLVSMIEGGDIRYEQLMDTFKDSAVRLKEYADRLNSEMEENSRLRTRIAELEANRSMPSGWWVGIALIGAMLLPWIAILAWWVKS